MSMKSRITSLIEQTGYLDGAGRFAPILRTKIENFIRNTNLTHKSDSEIVRLWNNYLHNLPDTSETSAPLGITVTPQAIYTFECLGFQNFKRVNCRDLDEARQAWTDAKLEIYEVVTDEGKTQQRWQAWELYQGSTLIKQGNF